jgi:hypothetical protein
MPGKIGELILSMENDSEIPEDILKILQRCVQLRPLIVLGTGASMQHGVRGMYDLAIYLKENLIPDPKDVKSWKEVVDKLDFGMDLESVIDETEISKDLRRKILSLTKEMVRIDDHSLLKKIIHHQQKLPLTELIQKISQTANPKISIITTNYDRMAEYAVDMAYLHHHTGFSYGFQKHVVEFPERSSKSFISQRIVDILKVHGSIDWFRTQNGAICSIPDFIEPPNDWEPMIVTPGISKYETVWGEPFRSIINRADKAFEQSESVISIGYGFNDKHIHPKLLEKSQKQQIPIIILAKKLTAKALEFIKYDSHSHDKVIGIEENGSGSKIFQSNNNDELTVTNNLWSLPEFLKHVS